MTVKDFFITLCFLGSVVLAAYGGWNYMWGRMNLYNETLKAEQYRAVNDTEYNNEQLLLKIKKERNKALIMFAAGATGMFFIIAYIYRRKRDLLIKQTKR